MTSKMTMTMTTRKPWYETLQERPQPIPLSELQEQEKVQALDIFEKYKDLIMGTIHGYLSSSASAEEKAAILSELMENCPSLYKDADEMRKENIRLVTDPLNGKPYVVKDQNKIVSNLRNKILSRPGFEEESIFMGSSARSTCDEAYWRDNHWVFNSIILFMIEKIGMLEVKKILN